MSICLSDFMKYMSVRYDLPPPISTGNLLLSDTDFMMISWRMVLESHTSFWKTARTVGAYRQNEGLSL